MSISGDLLLGFLLGIVTTLVTLSLNKAWQRLLNKSPCGCLTGILFLIAALALVVYFDLVQVQF
jgi:hypothetical protein